MVEHLPWTIAATGISTWITHCPWSAGPPGSTLKNEWRQLITRKTQESEEKRWRGSMESKTKLRLYKSIKTKLELEPYLTFKNRLARVFLARLRGGSNYLGVELAGTKDWSSKIELAGGVAKWKTKPTSCWIVTSTKRYGRT